MGRVGSGFGTALRGSADTWTEVYPTSLHHCLEDCRSSERDLELSYKACFKVSVDTHYYFNFESGRRQGR
jgi:hypothetical protein